MKSRITALLMAALLLSGCAKAVEPAPMFDSHTVQEASTLPEEPQRLIHSEVFSNGSTEFAVSIDTEFPSEPIAVVEAVPRFLTAQDAKSIIDAFFPQAQCFERHPAYTSAETNWTKASLEENLNRWRSYTMDDLAAFYGGAENLPIAMSETGEDLTYSEYWQSSLSYFEELLEKAPEEDMRTPSLWRMFKETEYHMEPEEAQRMDLSQDRDCIQASVEVGEDCYYYVVASGVQNGRPSSLVSLSYTTRSSPTEIDWQIFLSENEALPTPDQEQLDRAKEIAQSYVDRFPIGTWILTEAMPSGSDGTIYVEGYLAGNALPEAENEITYDTPRLSIRIHPDGTLLNFWMGGALTELVTHTTQADTLPWETLLDMALDCLRESDTMAYGLEEDTLVHIQTEAGEDFTCKAEITQAVQKFICMDSPGIGTVYVPCLTLYGSIDYFGKDTGQRIVHSLLPSGTVPFVTVNTLDGSIVSDVN